MTARYATAFFSLAALLLAGCSDADGSSDDGVADPGPLLPSAAAGAVAFRQQCAGCHASEDGLDLALFGYPDSTIIRRAVAHVDTATALDIVAHIATFDRDDFERDTRLFQPGGGEFVASDRAFAERLFGTDGWPADWTPDDLRAVDPLDVPITLGLPIWSVEEAETDWMPTSPIPPSILNDRGQRVRSLLAGYAAAPTEENLVLAIQAIRQATHTPEAGAALCPREEGSPGTLPCFEVQRWASSLGAMHMLRFAEDRLPAPIHDLWWDAGQTARRSVVGQNPIPQARTNWASWMYLGWMFEPGHHPSIYTSRGLVELGLIRHAAWVALRSLVAREPGIFTPLEDAFVYTLSAPATWTYEGLDLAEQEIRVRVLREDPLPEDRFFQDRTVAYIDQILRFAESRMPAEQFEDLEARFLELKSSIESRIASAPPVGTVSFDK